MRHRLALALHPEPSTTASRTREWILEQRFFGPGITPPPACVVQLLARTAPTRL